MDAIIEYVKNNIALSAIMAAILLLILILCIMLVVKSVKKSASKAEAERGTAEIEAAEKAEAEKAETETITTEKTEAENATTEKAEAETITTEKTEAENATTEKAAKKIGKKPVAKSISAKPVTKSGNASGKWIVYTEDRGGYGFRLIASNGEVMLTSSSPYASLQSAKAGIKTYQDNIRAERLEIIETKSGSFFVQINNANRRLLATSSDYKTRTSCESAAESIKRWAATQIVIVEESTGDKK